MNFNEKMLPISRDYIFEEDDFFVWGATMFKYNGNYYIIYSRWKKELGFQAWVTDSELCLAKSDSMLGKFKHVKVLFQKVSLWKDEKICRHNPTVIAWNGKFYLYYMMNHGHGDWWEHRNNQRIYVACAEDPEGAWEIKAEPIVDISEEGIDSLMTSNPAATVTADNKILMVYKAVSKYGDMPKGGKVLCGVAEADHPFGPFVKEGKPIMENPENSWSVEDPHIWREGDRFYALVKDFQGYFTKTDRCAMALFTSLDGKDWSCADHPLAFETQLDFGECVKPVQYLERPQLYIEDGKCKCLLCACMEEEVSCAKQTFNIRIPLQWNTD